MSLIGFFKINYSQESFWFKSWKRWQISENKILFLYLNLVHFSFVQWNVKHQLYLFIGECNDYLVQGGGGKSERGVKGQSRRVVEVILLRLPGAVGARGKRRCVSETCETPNTSDETTVRQRIKQECVNNFIVLNQNKQNKWQLN